MTTPQPTRTTVRTAVRKARPADAPAVSSVLAAAFHDDPLLRWIVPDDARRRVVNRAFFDAIVDVLAPHDDGWTTAHGVLGVALWVPYGREPVPAEDAEAFAARVAELSGPDADRMMEVFALFDEHHPHEPCEYLWFAGVEPGRQGRGIGSALLAPVLERADRAGVPCYLDATSPRNRRLYERHGFVARPAFAVAGGPPIWPMWRYPRRPLR